MAKLTKEQEYRALLAQCHTILVSLNTFAPSLKHANQPLIDRVYAALSEPKADAQDGEAV